MLVEAALLPVALYPTDGSAYVVVVPQLISAPSRIPLPGGMVFSPATTPRDDD